MDEFKDVLMDAADVLVDCGFVKSPSSITLHERSAIVKAISLHYIVFRSKAELDQLRSGLQTLGVGEAMHSNPELLEPLFTSTIPSKLSPGAYHQFSELATGISRTE